jgi:hypothetical protein
MALHSYAVLREMEIYQDRCDVYPDEESLEKQRIGELEEVGEISDIVVANGIHEQLQFF